MSAQLGRRLTLRKLCVRRRICFTLVIARVNYEGKKLCERYASAAENASGSDLIPENRAPRASQSVQQENAYTTARRRRERVAG